MTTTFTTLKEYKHFSKQQFWSIVEMTFNLPVITPPHYASTIEILFCEDVDGEITIGGETFEMHGNEVFFIAPNIVHSVNYQQCKGIVYVMKIDPDCMSHFLNIHNILDAYSMPLERISMHFTEYSEFKTILSSMLDKKIKMLDCIKNILTLFSYFIRYTKNNKTVPTMELTENEWLKEIINLTESSYQNKITIDDIASKMNYSKFYFCSKFKSITGYTYISYLNNVRISHACTLLKKNYSIEKVCERCGFDNASYFISVFRKIVGMTPKKYCDQEQ